MFVFPTNLTFFMGLKILEKLIFLSSQLKWVILFEVLLSHLLVFAVSASVTCPLFYFIFLFQTLPIPFSLFYAFPYFFVYEYRVRSISLSWGFYFLEIMLLEGNMDQSFDI